MTQCNKKQKFGGTNHFHRTVKSSDVLAYDFSNILADKTTGSTRYVLSFDILLYQVLKERIERTNYCIMMHLVYRLKSIFSPLDYHVPSTARLKNDMYPLIVFFSYRYSECLLCTLFAGQSKSSAVKFLAKPMIISAFTQLFTGNCNTIVRPWRQKA